jgi:hypothetical protein
MSHLVAPGGSTANSLFFWRGGVNGLDEEDSSHEEEMEGTEANSV